MLNTAVTWMYPYLIVVLSKWWLYRAFIVLFSLLLRVFENVPPGVYT